MRVLQGSIHFIGTVVTVEFLQSLFLSLHILDVARLRRFETFAVILSQTAS
jgi:hypothetical protein